MEWWQDFHFLRPYWLTALILPLIWGWYLFKNERVQSSWADVCDENLLNYLLIKGENKQRRISYVLSVLILFFAIIAVAGPSWVKKKNPAMSVDNPVMIMINLSTDMAAKDVSPNRLERAKYIVKDILQTFKTTETGLMVYSDEPFVISPLTEDVQLIDNLLPTLNVNVMPSNGDRLDKAIEMAVERMKQSGYEKGNLIVMTSDVGERFDAALEMAEKAHNQGFDVNIIKVSAADNEKLQMVANKGNGIYLNYNQNYAELSDKINNIYTAQIKESENMQTVWEDAGYYVFWLPALLLLYYFRKGILLVLVLFFLCAEAEAGLWLNENQQAMRYFKQQQYDKAAQMFKGADWRGAAAYKNGDYQRALKEFSQGADATSLYNQGNALAKMGKIDEAIEMYEKVLKQEPDFADAKFNLEYLKRHKEQQDSQNQKQEDKQDKQNQNNEQQSDKEKQQEQSQDQQQQDGEQKQQQKDSEQQQNQSGENQQQEQEQAQEQQGNEQQNAENQENNQQDNQAQNQNQQQQGEDSRDNSEQPQNGSNGEQNQQEKGQSAQSGAENSSDNSAQQQDEQSQQNDEGQEKEQQVQAQFGEEDENSEQKAQTAEVQIGDKDDEENKEKMRIRMQKFRDIPEDKGGLVRAIIAKEYRMRKAAQRAGQ